MTFQGQPGDLSGSSINMTSQGQDEVMLSLSDPKVTCMTYCQGHARV